MGTIILIIHLILVISMILVILVQKTGSDGLQGLAGGSNSGNALFSVRGKANVFTKVTTFLAIGFFTTSLMLAYLATHRNGHSIVDQIAVEKNSPTLNQRLPVNNLKADPAKVAPAVKPRGPEVPLAK